MTNSKSNADLPGPGNYNNSDLNSFGKNAPSVSLRGKAKDNKKSEIPGPGSYDQNSNNVKDKMAVHKIGTSKRGGIIDEKNL